MRKGKHGGQDSNFESGGGSCRQWENEFDARAGRWLYAKREYGEERWQRVVGISDSRSWKGGARERADGFSVG